MQAFVQLFLRERTESRRALPQRGLPPLQSRRPCVARVISLPDTRAIPAPRSVADAADSSANPPQTASRRRIFDRAPFSSPSAGSTPVRFAAPCTGDPVDRGAAQPPLL